MKIRHPMRLRHPVQWHSLCMSCLCMCNRRNGDFADTSLCVPVDSAAAGLLSDLGYKNT